MRSDFRSKPPLKGEDVTAMLRRLPAMVPPSGLTMSLRVLASRERQRANERRTVSSLYNSWKGRLRLTIQNMMRPFAVPLAGGMFSAVALFSTWVVPAYPARGHQMHIHDMVDVPTVLTTSPTLKNTSSMALLKSEMVLELDIDPLGRAINYQVVEGQALMRDPEVRRGVQNLLVWAVFDPATTFGKPTSGKVRLHLNSIPSRIDVKG